MGEKVKQALEAIRNRSRKPIYRVQGKNLSPEPLSRKQQNSDMKNNTTIVDIICNAINQDQSPEESAADLGEFIREMRREEENYGQCTQRMAKLQQLIPIQERVVLMKLTETSEDSPSSKQHHLRIVK